ncbi:MAG: DUF4832 domain-containing protein [Pseudobutyrivibrio sp.]|nr:DUF4832 domain-containing protein [Pseudobutyrivibrio sp.]
MKRSVRVLLTLSIITACIFAIVVYSFYFNIHMMLQPLNKSANYSNSTPYEFSITSASCSIGSLANSDVTITINISNLGTESTPDYCNVALTLINTKSNQPTMIGVTTDTRFWSPNSITAVPVTFNVSDIGTGNYGMYLSVLNNDGSTVEFNNSLRQTKNGYYLGTISILRLFQK